MLDRDEQTLQLGFASWASHNSAPTDTGQTNTNCVTGGGTLNLVLQITASSPRQTDRHTPHTHTHPPLLPAFSLAPTCLPGKNCILIWAKMGLAFPSWEKQSPRVGVQWKSHYVWGPGHQATLAESPFKHSPSLHEVTSRVWFGFLLMMC